MERRQRIIALSGRSGAGKDEVAKRLVERHGFRRVAFADALKAMLMDIDPHLGAFIRSVVTEGRRELTAEASRLRSKVDEIGWDALKSHPNYGPEVRRLMISLGKAMVERDKTFWCDQISEQLFAGGDVVVSDLRFMHEVKWLKARVEFRQADIEFWRVYRDFEDEKRYVEAKVVGQPIGDRSEYELDDFTGMHAILSNTGTLEMLHNSVDSLLPHFDHLLTVEQAREEDRRRAEAEDSGWDSDPLARFTPPIY